MTFTDTWQQGLQNQQNYIRNFELELSILEKRASMATVYDGTAPTTNQIQSTWQSKTGYDDNVPPFGKVQWYNPNREVVENIYLPINDLGTDLSSGNFFSLLDKNDETDIEVIEFWLLTESSTPVLTKTFTIPNTYSHLLILSNVKSLVNAASELMNMRVNGDTGANYDASYGLITNPTASVTSSTSAGTTSIFVASSPGGTADKNSFAFSIIEIPQYTVTKTTNHAFVTSLNNIGVPPAVAETLLWGAGQYKVSSIISSLTFFEATNFAPGTWILVLGIK